MVKQRASPLFVCQSKKKEYSKLISDAWPKQRYSNAGSIVPRTANRSSTTRSNRLSVPLEIDPRDTEARPIQKYLGASTRLTVHTGKPGRHQCGDSRRVGFLPASTSTRRANWVVRKKSTHPFAIDRPPLIVLTIICRTQSIHQPNHQTPRSVFRIFTTATYTTTTTSSS